MYWSVANKYSSELFFIKFWVVFAFLFSLVFWEWYWINLFECLFLICWLILKSDKEWPLTSFFFSIAILGLWFTSRVPKNPPLCSHFSHCSWISSLTRYAQSRMPWKAWWQESLSKVTPPKPSRRYAQAGQEPMQRPSRCMKRTELGRLLHQLVLLSSSRISGWNIGDRWSFSLLWPGERSPFCSALLFTFWQT